MRADDKLLQLSQDGLSTRQIIDRTGYSPSAVRGMLSKARKRAQEQWQEHAEVADLLSHLEEPSSKDIHDREQLHQWLNQRRQNDQLLSIQLWPDLHLRDTDPRCVDLGLQIAAHLKPELHLFNGDTFDFDQIAVFLGKYNRPKGDVLKEVQPDWNKLHDRLDKITPAAKRLAIGGNHCLGRIEKWINEHAPMFGDTLIESFIELYRAKRRVWWGGWTDELWLGPMHIQHGERYGQNAAKKASEDVGGAMHQIGSHSHNFTTYTNISYQKNPADLFNPFRQVIQSTITPCMCNIHPHYRYDKKKSKWVQGIGVYHADLNTLEVHHQTIIFREIADGRLRAVFGDHVFTSRKNPS